MPIASPQVIQPPPIHQEAGIKQYVLAHSVAAIEAQCDNLDETSTLCGTETENAKAMGMLHQYLVSLAASGTVRRIVGERELITNRLGIILRKVKFIHADLDLSFEQGFAKILYKEQKS